MTTVAGRIVTRQERLVLEDLVDASRTARAIGVRLESDGWTMLRMLSSLAARGLVTSYMHNGVTAWRLSDGARAQLT